MRKRSGSLLGAVLLAVGLGLVGYTLYSWFAEPADTTPVDARLDATDSAMFADTAPWNQPTPLSQTGGLGDRSYAALPGASPAVAETTPVATPPADTSSTNSTSATTTTPTSPSNPASTVSPSDSMTSTPLPGATISNNNPGTNIGNADPAGPTTPLSGTAEHITTAPTTAQPTVPLIDPPGSTLPLSVNVDATPTGLTPGFSSAGGAGTPTTHKIESGDTLGSIAKKYLGKESRWPEIAKLNPSLDPHRLKIGDVVKLPEAAAGGSSSTSTYTSSPSDPPSEIVVPIGSKTHTVREGDTFWIIAEEHYGSGALWQTIYRANKPIVGNNPDKLTTGMKLIIPPKPGEVPAQ